MCGGLRALADIVGQWGAFHRLEGKLRRAAGNGQSPSANAGGIPPSNEGYAAGDLLFTIHHPLSGVRHDAVDGPPCQSHNRYLPPCPGAIRAGLFGLADHAGAACCVGAAKRLEPNGRNTAGTGCARRCDCAHSDTCCRARRVNRIARYLGKPGRQPADEGQNVFTYRNTACWWKWVGRLPRIPAPPILAAPTMAQRE